MAVVTLNRPQRIIKPKRKKEPEIDAVATKISSVASSAISQIPSPRTALPIAQAVSANPIPTIAPNVSEEALVVGNRKLEEPSAPPACEVNATDPLTEYLDVSSFTTEVETQQIIETLRKQEEQDKTAVLAAKTLRIAEPSVVPVAASIYPKLQPIAVPAAAAAVASASAAPVVSKVVAFSPLPSPIQPLQMRITQWNRAVKELPSKGVFSLLPSKQRKNLEKEGEEIANEIVRLINNHEAGKIHLSTNDLNDLSLAIINLGKLKPKTLLDLKFRFERFLINHIHQNRFEDSLVDLATIYIGFVDKADRPEKYINLLRTLEFVFPEPILQIGRAYGFSEEALGIVKRKGGDMLIKKIPYDLNSLEAILRGDQAAQDHAAQRKERLNWS